VTSTNFSFLAKGHDPLSVQFVPQDPNDEPASVPLERIHAEREASQPVKSKRGASTSTPARARTSRRAP
jgi:hypothetical protein